MARSRSALKTGFARAASRVAQRERAIQRPIDRADRRKKSSSKRAPKQTGARHYPMPPFPRQHQKKPGREAVLKLKPMYDAPYYKGSDKLKGARTRMAPFSNSARRAGS